MAKVYTPGPLEEGQEGGEDGPTIVPEIVDLRVLALCDRLLGGPTGGRYPDRFAYMASRWRQVAGQ